jgi:nitroreductase
MKDALEAIKRRISVRSYAAAPLTEALKERLQYTFDDHKNGPFGNEVRFQLLDFDAVGRAELRGLGTYGFIKGARLFILAAVKKRKHNMEDLGYCLESVILEATAMGLGTCWLGGTFRRSRFAARMDLQDDELLPAITPVGYPAEAIALTDRMLRYGAGSQRRKPWSELFFAFNGITPLTEDEAGDYREPLEALRLGPSASNRQPWRMLKDESGFYHLYLKENILYNRAQGKIRLQNIDMGIAMCHFALAAEETGLGGRWKEMIPCPNVQGLNYIATWVPAAG